MLFTELCQISHFSVFLNVTFSEVISKPLPWFDLLPGHIRFHIFSCDLTYTPKKTLFLPHIKSL